MWDETLIESKKRNISKRKWITLPVAMVVHALILMVLVVSSFWKVEAVPPANQIIEPVLVGFYPPISKGVPDGVRRRGDSRPLKPQPKEVTQSVEVKNTTPVSSELGEPGPTDKELPYGDPEGSENGKEDGVVGFPTGEEISPVVAGPGDEILNVWTEDPVLLKRVEPEYPLPARVLKLQGIVVLEAVITRNGDVEVRRVKQSVHPILDQAAIRAVSQWKYRPARVQGRPVHVYFTITVNFRLR